VTATVTVINNYEVTKNCPHLLANFARWLLDRMSLYLNGSRTRDSRSKPYESLHGKRMYLCFVL